MAPRGRGGKFGKPSRGGGRHYSRNIETADSESWREPRDQIASSSSEEESSSSEEEESGSDNEQQQKQAAEEKNLTREERRALAKKRKEAAAAKRRERAAQPGDLPPSSSEDESEDDAQIANPNHTSKSKAMAAGKPVNTQQRGKPAAGGGGEFEGLSRREREAVQAQQARERYMKLHAEGKTDEAKADLARLAIVRERREQERLRKEAEKEEKEEKERQRRELTRERDEKLRAAAQGKKGKAKK